jgi:hypothetical protein
VKVRLMMTEPGSDVFLEFPSEAEAGTSLTIMPFLHNHFVTTATSAIKAVFTLTPWAFQD